MVTRCFLILILFASAVQAQFLPHRRAHFQPVAAGGGSDVLKDSADGTRGSSQTFGGLGPDDWLASPFTASSSYTLHQVDVVLFKTGSPSWTMNAYIFADSANAPTGSALGTGSANLSASTVTGTASGTAGTNSFTSMAVSITSGVKYWIVIKATGSPHDFANYANWVKNGNGKGASDLIFKSSDGAAWNQADNFAQNTAFTYGQ